MQTRPGACQAGVLLADLLAVEGVQWHSAADVLAAVDAPVFKSVHTFARDISLPVLPSQFAALIRQFCEETALA